MDSTFRADLPQGGEIALRIQPMGRAVRRGETVVAREAPFTVRLTGDGERDHAALMDLVRITGPYVVLSVEVVPASR